jgi:hypothetical protein
MHTSFIAAAAAALVAGRRRSHRPDDQQEQSDRWFRVSVTQSWFNDECVDDEGGEGDEA